jgi:hypothetical protein
MKNTRLSADSMTGRLCVAVILNIVVWGTVIARPSLFGAALAVITSLAFAWMMMGRRRSR